MRRWRLRAALFLAVGLGTVGFALVAYGANVFRELDLDTVDARFSIRGTQEPPADLVVVAIDSEAISSFGQFPFRRKWHARLLRRLKADGARVVAYDVQFTEESPYPEDDNALIEAVRGSGNIVMSTTQVADDGSVNVFGGGEGLRYSRARVGNGLLEPDRAAVLRRIPYEVEGLKSFAVVSAELATGRPVDRSDFEARRPWIDFHGPPGTILEIPFRQAVSGKTKPGFFRDKIVVVGVTAPTEHDLHPTSTTGDELMSGAEVQANAISTVLRGLPLKSLSGWLNVLLVIGLGMLAPLSGLVLSLRGTILISLAAGLAFAGGTQLAFERGWIVTFVYPFGALALSSVGAVGGHYLLAAFERERVRDIFSRFVPADVVDDVLARTDADLRLGGVTVEATIMFTDLRGFTTFSEALPASEVIEVVNVYLSEMTEAILAHGGTLVSYEGDGIMAVFGAPIEQADHADRAIETAREMLDVRLPSFNDWLREQGYGDGFRMGIGLNSGTIVSGNVGSQERLEYTVLGDATNTASRLQGMTKGTPHSVFVSDSTRECLQREVEDLIYVDELEVRGRQAKVKLWSLGNSGVAPPSS